MKIEFKSNRKKKEKKEVPEEVKPIKEKEEVEEKTDISNDECAVIEYKPVPKEEKEEIEEKTNDTSPAVSADHEISDIESYRPDINETLSEKKKHLIVIDERLDRVNQTLNRLQTQELFMDDLIRETLGRIKLIDDPKHFKKKSQLQGIFMRQSEAQTLLIDAINKQENLIKQYLDAKRKIENDHFRNYKLLNDIKLEDAQQSSLTDMLFMVEKFFMESKTNSADTDLMDVVEAELLEDNG